AILMVGYAAIIVATMRGWWGSVRYWTALAVGALVAVISVLPAFLPYLQLQRAQGFSRSLDDARQYSANWSDFLASSSNLHAWMLPHLPPWVEVSFPGFIALGFGLAGLWVGRRHQRGELVAIYGGLAVLAFWAAFGPAAGLYSVLYKSVPLFAWLRAPARFGLIVSLAMAVL